MRFILFTEGGTLRGETHHRRHHDLIEEAKLAEEMGFYGWGTSEHHFYNELATVSQPPVMFGAVAVQTHRMKLRYMSRLVSAIHPILVAEQTTSTDILSNGRVELAVARGNTLLQLDAFGVPLEETKGRAEEALELIVRAISDPSFSHEGRYWGSIPERQLTPSGVQEPHPPLFKIAQSVDSARDARRRGLGLITSDMYFGWDALQSYLDAYNDVPDEEVDPVGRFATKSAAAMSITCRCAKTNDLALEAAERDMTMFAQVIINDLYAQLAERDSGDYGHFAPVAELRDRIDDPEWLRDCGPTMMIGDPEHVVRKIQRIKEMGADEIILRIDNGSHEELMSTIEHLGRYVIPYFNNPSGVLRDTVIGMLPGDPRQTPSYEATAKAGVVA
ncbi:MAG: LLM class flavin-dependent oxidoreductase [Solirubrobacteraceae bacterium]|nr:LLM class flavin-dependent oxidoreductase [Solirubrobacteraceae bacterium]